MSTMTIDQMFTAPAPRAQAPRAEAPRAQARPAGAVRLTRRGRVVVVLLALVAVLAIGLLVGQSAVATDEAGTPEPTRVVVVNPGDTLWDIASAAAPDGDVRAMVNRIIKLNALDGGLVDAGQRLMVPLD